MNDLLSLIAHHGYLVIFLAVLAESVGMPVPSALALIGGGAAVASGALRGPVVAVLAITAMLLGDSLLYVLGNLMGWRLLGFLCRVSVNSETCILRAAESFYKRGRAALLIAKFIPGVNTMAPPLAGSMEMPFLQFLGLDFLGATAYAFAYGGIGYFFRDFIAAITRGVRTAGHAVELVIILAAIAFIVYRVSLYWKHRVDRVVPRVQVAELARKLQSVGPGKVLLVDVRSHGYYDPGAARIQGSIRIEPNNLSNEIQTLPKDKDIYLYCT
jgi:membrane protein DedA with SNARE-associated domain